MTCKTCGDRRTVHYAESTCQPAHEGPCPSCAGVTIATSSVGAVSGSAEGLRDVAVKAEDAMREMFRYFDGGETRGSYDGKPERNGLRKAWYALRAALTEGQQS